MGSRDNSHPRLQNVAVNTVATPLNSPSIIHNVRRYPIERPNVNAKVIQSPGVNETDAIVGMNNKIKSGDTDDSLRARKYYFLFAALLCR